MARQVNNAEQTEAMVLPTELNANKNAMRYLSSLSPSIHKTELRIAEMRESTQNKCVISTRPQISMASI